MAGMRLTQFIPNVTFQSDPEVQLGAPERVFAIDDEIEAVEYHTTTRRFVGLSARTLAELRFVVETEVR